jgi:hypothetical protein
MMEDMVEKRPERSPPAKGKGEIFFGEALARRKLVF